jgi:hypothetical protein
MRRQRLDAEDKRSRKRNSLALDDHIVVKVAFRFRLADHHRLVRVRILEQQVPVLGEHHVGRRVGIGKRKRKIGGQRLAQLLRHRGEEIRLSRFGCSQDRHKKRLQFQQRAGNRQVAIGASQRVAHNAFGVDCVAFYREPAGQEATLMLVAEAIVLEQIAMLGNPQRFLGREPVPAMWAGYFGLET